MILWKNRSRRGGDERNENPLLPLTPPLVLLIQREKGREGRENETKKKEREVKYMVNYYKAMKKMAENREAWREWVPKTCLRAEYL